MQVLHPVNGTRPPVRVNRHGIESRQLLTNIKQNLAESGDPVRGGIRHAKVLVEGSKVKPGEHSPRPWILYDKEFLQEEPAQLEE